MNVSINSKKLRRISRINEAVRDYFDSHPGIAEVPAKNLMKLFIEKNIFFKNRDSDFSSITHFLRQLDKEEKLNLVTCCKIVRSKSRRHWYFTK